MALDKKIFDSVMIDWETMGTGPQAAVVQLGAVAFSWKTGEVDATRAYLQDIDLTSSLMLGGYSDRSTVEWWRGRGGFQPSGPVKDLRTVLVAFAAWKRAYPNAERVWCRGLSFDVAIAEGYYRAAKLELPWAYNKGRDTRSVEDVARDLGWEPAPVETTHNAQRDCFDQITQVMSALRYLRSGPWLQGSIS